jgi:hypothetical protein
VLNPRGRGDGEDQVSRALGKLHARDRAQLVTLAYEPGLVLARQPTKAGFTVPTATLAARPVRRGRYSEGDLGIP